VPETPARPATTSVRWPVPIVLAVPALAAAVVITFSSGHSGGFGLLVFGGFALLTGVAAGFGALLLPAGPARIISGAKAVAAAAGGVVAIALLRPVVDGADPEGAAIVFEAVAVGTLVLLAAADLVLGLRLRRRDRYGRDWIATGVIEALGALLVVVVPPTFSQAFSFTDAGEVVSGAVTASTTMVGLFGAIAAVLGVFLAIAGAGLVPSRARTAA